MSDKFVVNNYEGVPVSCSQSVWEEHIEVHHAIMSHNVEAVKDTIKDPDTVYLSKENENRKVYFKNSSYSSYNFRTKVIVEDTETKAGDPKGEVVTTFPVKDEKGGIADVVYKRTND